MAERNYWYIKDGRVVQGVIDMIWVSGMAFSRRKLSCRNLLGEIEARLGLKPLDISSASPSALGVALSAFNLKWDGRTIECWYQGSKVYKLTGAQHQLYDADSKTAKLSMSNRASGDVLVGFRLKKDGVEKDFPMSPRTLFYDWIYLQGMRQNWESIKSLNLDKYNCFTDVQAKLQIDACQARTVCECMLIDKTNAWSVLDSLEQFTEWHKAHVKGETEERASGTPSVDFSMVQIEEDEAKLDSSAPVLKEFTDKELAILRAFKIIG